MALDQLERQRQFIRLTTKNGNQRAGMNAAQFHPREIVVALGHPAIDGVVIGALFLDHLPERGKSLRRQRFYQDRTHGISFM
mgnify:CR=1 FL=1